MRILLAFMVLVFGSSLAIAQALTEPSDVTNVKAEALDSAVNLTWNAATDDGLIIDYKIYYGTTPVTDEDVKNGVGGYDDERLTNSAEPSFTVENLVNGDTYYFAVTAVDDQGLESEFYSVEVSATPGSDANNTDDGSPILISAKHEAQNRIVVVMSEPVQLDDPTEAYELIDDFTGSKIDILEALVNSQRVTLIVDSADIVKNDVYRVTATTGVTDFEGNPVSSGVVDSVEFVGQGDFLATEETDEEGLEDDEAEEVLIDEPLFDDTDLASEGTSGTPPDEFGTFFLDDNRAGSNTSDFLDSLLEPTNPINELPSKTNTPEPSLEPDLPLNMTDGLSSAPDQVPPNDARNLMADTSTMTAGQVELSWQVALDIDNDIKDQVLYMRVGLGAWDTGLSLGKNLNKTTINVQPNQNYQVRLVTVDNAGNESFGAAFEFATTLNQSGGGQGTVIALSVMAIFGFMFLFAGGRRA